MTVPSWPQINSQPVGKHRCRYSVVSERMTHKRWGGLGVWQQLECVLCKCHSGRWKKFKPALSEPGKL
jgi:hypothetical protein